MRDRCCTLFLRRLASRARIMLGVSSLLLALLLIPAAGFSSVLWAQYFLSLQSAGVAGTNLIRTDAGHLQALLAPGMSRAAEQRWYTSFLTQQEVITRQVEELRQKLHENTIGTGEFLESLEGLLARADGLYAQWKRLGPGNRLAAQPHTGRKVMNAFSEAAAIARRLTQPTTEPSSRDTTEAAREPRKDLAVGKSLNYLRLSILNFFLGYADSNGRQIDDAERQVLLSRLWRSRSLLFIRQLETTVPETGSSDSEHTRVSLGQQPS